MSAVRPINEGDRAMFLQARRDVRVSDSEELLPAVIRLLNERASTLTPDDVDGLLKEYESESAARHRARIEAEQKAASKRELNEEYRKRKRTARLNRQIKRELDAEELPPSPPPQIFTLRQLLDQPEEEVPWRIKDLQPKGTRVMLAAQFKAGKTTLGGNLVRSLRDGDPFLDEYDVEAVDGAIAILDFEMSTNQLRRWYRDQGIREDERVVIVPMRGLATSFNILDVKVRAEWVARLKALNVRYLILDCLRPVLDALGLDEHHDVGKFLGPFDALLAEADIPDALVVHHMGHNGDRSRGDSRLRDWPDVEWRLTRLDDDPASPRYFTAYGRDVEVPERELGFDPDTRHLNVVGGSRKDKKATEALPVVLAFIAAAEKPPSRNAILAGLKKSGHSQDALKAAIKRGITTNDIWTEPGDRGAQLHHVVTGDERPEPPAEAYL